MRVRKAKAGLRVALDAEAGLLGELDFWCLPELRELRLRGRNGTPEQLRKLLQYGRPLSLQRFDLSENPGVLGDGPCEWAHLECLQELSLARCRVTPDQLTQLLDYGQPPSLQKLDLSENPGVLGDGLCDFSGMKHLRELCLAECDVTPRQIKQVVRILLDSEELDLYPDLTVDLSGNPALKELGLSRVARPLELLVALAEQAAVLPLAETSLSLSPSSSLLVSPDASYLGVSPWRPAARLHLPKDRSSRCHPDGSSGPCVGGLVQLQGCRERERWGRWLPQDTAEADGSRFASRSPRSPEIRRSPRSRGDHARLAWVSPRHGAMEGDHSPRLATGTTRPAMEPVAGRHQARSRNAGDNDFGLGGWASGRIGTCMADPIIGTVSTGVLKPPRAHRSGRAGFPLQVLRRLLVLLLALALFYELARWVAWSATRHAGHFAASPTEDCRESQQRAHTPDGLGATLERPAAEREEAAPARDADYEAQQEVEDRVEVLLSQALHPEQDRRRRGGVWR